MGGIRQRYWLRLDCIWAPVGLVLLLAACADPAARWHLQGVSDARRDADYQQCRDQSRTTYSGRIDRLAADPSPSGVLNEPGAGGPPTGLDQREADREDASFLTCMTDKGYRGE